MQPPADLTANTCIDYGAR